MTRQSLSFLNDSEISWRTGFLLLLLSGCDSNAPQQPVTKSRQIDGDIVVPIKISEIQSTCERFLDSTPDDWWLRDLTDSYDLPAGVRMAWVIDEESDESLILVSRDDGSWERTNTDGSNTTISALLASSFDDNSPKPLELAKHLLEWRQDPRGIVLSQSFLRENIDDLESFTLDDNNKVDELKSLCHDPVVTKESSMWLIEFKALDRQGAISHWQVRGVEDTFEIAAITINKVHPAETFYYPFEF